MRPSIQTIVFDFGNVIGYFDPGLVVARLAAHAALPAEELRTYLFGGPLEDAYESGQLSTETFLAQLRRECGLRCEEEGQLVLRTFDLEISARGAVRFVQPGVGVGIEFVELTDADRGNLQELIARLATGAVLAAHGDQETPQRKAPAEEEPPAEPTPSVPGKLQLQVAHVRRWTNRRRTERVILSVPIEVRGDGPGGKSFSEHTETTVVNQHGGLFRLGHPVEPGQDLVIQHKKTSQTMECTIIYVGNREGNSAEVGVEFTRDETNFWGISFPGKGRHRA